MTTSITVHPTFNNPPPSQHLAAKPHNHLVNDDFLSFSGLIDALNPFNQIPGVSELASLGEEAVEAPLEAGSKLIGGLIYGGPVGFVTSLIDTIVEETFGEGLLSSALSVFDSEPTTQIAKSNAIRAYNNTGALF